MNERIQALAEQADFGADQIISEVVGPVYSGPEMHKVVDAYLALPLEIRTRITATLKKNQEKFVELIVNECVRAALTEIVEDAQIDAQSDAHWKLYLKGNNSGILDAVVAIRQCFDISDGSS